jgi:hypothetical protein
MLKTLLLVTITWTTMSFLFCVAWSRVHSRARAIVSRTPVEVPDALSFTLWRLSSPVPGHDARGNSH